MRQFSRDFSLAFISFMLGLLGAAMVRCTVAIQDELAGIREELHSARVAPLEVDALGQTCEVGDE